MDRKTKIDFILRTLQIQDFFLALTDAEIEMLFNASVRYSSEIEKINLERAKIEIEARLSQIGNYSGFTE